MRSIPGGRLLYVAISLKPYFIVFVASACVLIIEIVAARLLAPMIGVSLYTWTSIIGVVLTGISVGNYLGGRVADRYPSQATLGLILLAGGISTLSILPLLGLASEAFVELPYIARIVFLTATLFFVPSLILAMVTPLVIKLRLQDLAETGNIVGKIYAYSTAGSIFGTFITGFVLIQTVGTRLTLLLVALVLVLMAVVFGNLWRIKVPTGALLGLFLGLGFVSFLTGALDSDCTRESNYYCISVEEEILEGGAIAKTLYLDSLLHSYVSLEDPTLLTYGYEKVMAEIAAHIANRNPSIQVLFIGGGGYTMPRYLEVTYPQSALEVIEIDPEVTRVAFEYLGLWPDTRIVTHNEDARIAIPRLKHGNYDLVIGDAFNDFSVPYHLTTREFNEQVRALLNDEGIYAVNVIDKLYTGRFLRAYVNTLQLTFPHVYIIRSDSIWESDTRNTFVVVASGSSLDSTDLKDASIQIGRSEPVSNLMPNATLNAWLGSRENTLLTDDFAPVDNLMAPVYSASRGLSEAEEHYVVGVELQNQERFKEALAQYDEAISFDPQYAQAYNNRGSVYASLGQIERAIQDYDMAVGVNSLYADAYNNRGAAYARLGQNQRAILDFDVAIGLNPELTIAFHNRGNAHTDLGQFQRAIQDYNEVISLDPQHVEAYNNRGNAYARQGQFQRAIQDYDAAISLNPELAPAYYNRGSVHSDLGQLQRAIQDYDVAISLNPQYVQAYNNRGSVYGDLGQFEQAVQDYSEAIRLNPQLGQAYANRALAYAFLNMDEEAQLDIGRAATLGIDPFLLNEKIEELTKGQEG